jgi:hypothetical protein
VQVVNFEQYGGVNNLDIFQKLEQTGNSVISILLLIR